MSYATRDDLVQAFGADMVERLSVREGDADGLVTVARALAYAASLIDAHLSTRYPLPIDAAATPPILVVIATDLAIDRMASDRVSRTDDIADRAKSARADLKMIQEGRMNLGLPAKGPTDSPQPVLSNTGAGGRVSSGRDKLFARDDLRDL